MEIFITEFGHPCTVDVKVCANDSEQCLAKFSLDLVSPVEYLFRKYSLKDNGMSYLQYISVYVGNLRNQNIH